MTIDLESLTVKEVKELAVLAQSLLGCAPQPTAVPPSSYFGEVKVGEKVFVATVTRYYIGRVKSIGHDWLTLEESGWCAQTGQFTDFLEKGTPLRFQPSPLPWQMLGRGAIVEVSPWLHELPRKKIGS